jgi:RHS repeat-associated protein
MTWIGPVSAQNENETVGFQINHIFEGGQFGEDIDILNGGLNLTLPIGQRYQVNQSLGYGLTLNYSSKIYRADGLQGLNRLVRVGNVGLGFGLNLGRIYRDVATIGVTGANTGECKWYYVSPDGNEHPIYDDTPHISCDPVPMQAAFTTDTTYFTVSHTSFTGWNGSPATAPTFTVGTPDGTVYEFGHLVQVYPSSNYLEGDLPFSAMDEPTTRYNRDFGGWYVTKIYNLKAGGASEVVNISYDIRSGYEHAISSITDGRDRLITFTNSCQPQAGTPSGCVEVPLGTNAPNRVAVRTTSITVPVFNGTTATASCTAGHACTVGTYDFTYDWKTVTSSWVTQNPITFGPVNVLTRIDYPQVTNHAGSQQRYSMTFGYDLLQGSIVSGEFTSRGLPTGATEQFTWAGYGYLAAPGGGRISFGSETRQLTNKKLILAGEPNPAEWKYERLGTTSGNPYTNPQSVIVTDPLGNDTIYRYRASRPETNPSQPPLPTDDGWAPEWDDGVNYVTEYHQGTGASRRLVRTEGKEYDADAAVVGSGLGQTNVRTKRTVTTFIDDGSRTATVANSNWDGVGHWKTVTELADGVEPRTTRSEYRLTDPDRLLLREVQEQNRVVSRIENTYDGIGRLLLTIERKTLPSAINLPSTPQLPIVNGDVLTSYTWDSNTGTITQKEVGDQGIAGAPKYRIHYTWQGGYLAKKEFYDWVAGAYFPWKAIDRDRDGNTGLIFTTRDVGGVASTTYLYDTLGRVKDIQPSASERPTQIEYIDIRHTTLRQGDPAVMGSNYNCAQTSGDFSMSCYEYDVLGRLTKTQKRPADTTATVPYQTTDYNILGWKTFESEWVKPGDPLVGTTYIYTDPSDPTQSDPFGRIRKVVTADGKETETIYFGLSTAVTVKGIKAPDGTTYNATTTYERDPLNRLTSVFSPQGQGGPFLNGGADAQYFYDARDNLVEVQLVDHATLFKQVRTFEYDPLNRLLSSYNPESGTQEITGYDPLGNVTASLDGSGNKLITTYDGAGRVKTLQRQDYQKPGGGTPPIVTLLQNTYDQGGAFGPHSSGRLTTSMDYDEAGAWVHTLERYYAGLNGRVSTERHTYGGWTVASEAVPIGYTYTLFGQVDTLTYPEGSAGKGGAFSITYKYSNGFAIEAWDPAQPLPPAPGAQAQAALLYNPAGGIQQVKTFGSMRTDITPDSRNRPSNILIGHYNGVTLDRTDYQSGAYEYDGAGNISKIGSNEYGYDAANRLVRAFDLTDGVARKQIFAYDDFGNMLQKDLYDINDTLLRHDVYAFGIQSSGYNDNRLRTHQVDAGAASTFIHDGRGNVVQGDGQKYDLDTRNRATATRSIAGSVQGELARYAYDGASSRVRKDDVRADLLTFYVRDGEGRLLSEFRRTRNSDYTPEWVKHYIYVGDRLVGMKENRNPQPPGLITATTNRPAHTVTLVWTPPPTGEGYTVANYKVYRSPNTTPPTWTLRGSPVAATYTDSVTNNIIYKYMVTVVDTSVPAREGYGVGPLVVTAGNISLPNPPAGLVVVAGDRRADLSWTANGAAEQVIGYHVYRGIGAGAAVKITQAPVAPIAFKDLGLDNGTTYRYSISAVNSVGGESTRSSEISIVPADYTPPDVPRNLTASADCNGTSTVTVTWDASPSPEFVTYVVHRTPQFPGGPTYPSGGTTFVDAQANPGTLYTYTVNAIDLGSNNSLLSQPATARTRATPGQVAVPSVPYAESGDGQVTLRVSLPAGVAKVLLYRKRNVDQACSAYEYVDEATNGKLLADSVENGLAWDYALSGVDASGNESAFSSPALATPVAIPQGVTSCIEELPANADGASQCPQNGTQQTPWRRLAVRWVPTSQPLYQPYADHSEGSLGYFKGIRFYRYQAHTGNQSADQSTLVPVQDDYFKGYCPSLPDQACGYLDLNGSTICPNGESCAHTNDGIAAHDGYGECSASNRKCMVNADCASGETCNSAPIDPALIMYGEERFNGPFVVTEGGTCLAAKAAYKVFENGHWLTVESGFSDMLQQVATETPADRCTLGMFDVCNANLHPDAFAPESNPQICPNASTLPRAPAAPTASSSSPGTITVNWAPPSGTGTCALTAPANCFSSACPASPTQYCAESDTWHCRLSSPQSCSQTPDCPQTPVAQTCVQNTANQITGYRLYVAEVDPDRHHFVRPASTVLTMSAATTSHTFTGLNDLLRSGVQNKLAFRVATVDQFGRASDPSPASAVITPMASPNAITPPASLKTIVWTDGDAGTDYMAPLLKYPHPRDLIGIKLAWKDKYTTAPIELGYRVYRQTSTGGWCALLKAGTPQNPNPPGISPCYNEITQLYDDPNAYSELYTTGPSGGNRVYVDKTVLAGVTHTYAVSVVTSSGESNRSASVTGIALPHAAQPLSPPAYFSASAPDGPSSNNEWRGIFLRWCANNPLEGVTQYKIYRSTGPSNRQGPFTLLATVAPACLDQGKQCIITTVGQTITTPTTSCTPGITGNCDVIDRTFLVPSGYPVWYSLGEGDYSNQVNNYTYNYVVTAVRDLGGSNVKESGYSKMNMGWLNYCDTASDTSCGVRYDPDDFQDTPCGDESSRLDVVPPVEEGVAIASQAPPVFAETPYRLIGSLSDLPNAPNAVSRFVYHHLDHLGTPRVITDSGGALVSKHHYMPFGDEMPAVAQGTTNKRQYTGHERDPESGLDYMLARYYHSSIGRFLEADAGSDIQLMNPQSWNSYAYVANNPINSIDPDGQAHRPVHALIALEAGLSARTAKAVADVDAGFLFIPDAAFHPREHFGGMDEADRLVDEAIAARMTGDSETAEGLMIKAYHCYGDVAFHKDSNGNPIGWWNHLWRVLGDALSPGRRFSPDSEERSDFKKKLREAVKLVKSAKKKYEEATSGASTGSGANMCPHSPPPTADGQRAAAEANFAGGPSLEWGSGPGGASNR